MQGRVVGTAARKKVQLRKARGQRDRTDVMLSLQHCTNTHH